MLTFEAINEKIGETVPPAVAINILAEWLIRPENEQYRAEGFTFISEQIRSAPSNTHNLTSKAVGYFGYPTFYSLPPEIQVRFVKDALESQYLDGNSIMEIFKLFEISKCAKEAQEPIAQCFVESPKLLREHLTELGNQTIVTSLFPIFLNSPLAYEEVCGDWAKKIENISPSRMELIPSIDLLLPRVSEIHSGKLTKIKEELEIDYNSLNFRSLFHPNPPY